MGSVKRVVPVELMGGPLDRQTCWIVPDEERITFRDGIGVAEYVRDEITEGPKVRTVFRYVVPLPRREGSEE